MSDKEATYQQETSEESARKKILEISEAIFNARLTRESKKPDKTDLLGLPIATVSIIPDAPLNKLTSTSELVAKQNNYRIRTKLGEIPNFNNETVKNGLTTSLFGNHYRRIFSSYYGIHGLVELRQSIAIPDRDQTSILAITIGDLVLIALQAATSLYKTFEFSSKARIIIQLDNIADSIVMSGYGTIGFDSDPVADLDHYEWEETIDQSQLKDNESLLSFATPIIEQINFDLGVEGLSLDNHNSFKELRSKTNI